MKTSPLKKPFLLTGVLTAVAVAVRLVLQLVAIDHSTGFYYATGLGRGAEIVFNLFLAAALVLIWLAVRGERAHFGEKPRHFGNEFFIGLMLMGFTAELSYLFQFLTEMRALFGGHGLYLPSALPAIIFVLGGVLLLYQGLLGISGKQDSIDLLSAAILAIWGAAALVCTYLSHSIVYHVSDNMLHILAVAALAFFLANCLKYMMGTEVATSGRRTVLYGLMTFFFGCTLVLPRLVSLLVNGNVESLGAPNFSELIFVMIAALVAGLAAWTIAFGCLMPTHTLIAKPAEAVDEAVEEPTDKTAE